MLYNIFAPQDGTTYGALACSACNKNVAFELEPQADLRMYGEGARINMLASSKPPNVERKKQMEIPH